MLAAAFLFFCLAFAQGANTGSARRRFARKHRIPILASARVRYLHRSAAYDGRTISVSAKGLKRIVFNESGKLFNMKRRHAGLATGLLAAGIPFLNEAESRECKNQTCAAENFVKVPDHPHSHEEPLRSEAEPQYVYTMDSPTISIELGSQDFGSGLPKIPSILYSMRIVELRRLGRFLEPHPHIPSRQIAETPEGLLVRHADNKLLAAGTPVAAVALLSNQ